MLNTRERAVRNALPGAEDDRDENQAVIKAAGGHDSREFVQLVDSQSPCETLTEVNESWPTSTLPFLAPARLAPVPRDSRAGTRHQPLRTATGRLLRVKFCDPRRVSTALHTGIPP